MLSGKYVPDPKSDGALQKAIVIAIRMMLRSVDDRHVYAALILVRTRVRDSAGRGTEVVKTDDKKAADVAGKCIVVQLR